MKNLMNRDEYLQNTNEGFIKDTIKKGFEKVKSLFKIGVKKIKDFIAIFDGEGNVFPVVSPCAVIDKFSDSEAIRVYAPKALSQVAVDAGGNGCEERAELKDDDEIYDDGPKGKDYALWIKDEKYKDTPEYKNFLKLDSMLKESKNLDGVEIIDESWDEVSNPDNRNKYSYDEAFGNSVKSIDHIKFEKWIDKFIEQRITNGGKTVVRASDGRVAAPERNMLVFGAPGIGKSTIPNTVVKKYNKDVAKGDPAKMISIINVNCALLHSGDILMPTMPKEDDITRVLKNFSKTFPEASGYLDSLSDEDQDAISQTINRTSQFKSTDAPKSWLPSYKPVGDKRIDMLLDSYANGGTVEDEDGFTIKTGNGGIIIFDEFLRADEDVFSELMNFLLNRQIHDWKLGSKWVIIACSNRPCDDDKIASIWNEWNGAPAMKGRFSRIFQLVPDPEAWQAWALSKGCDKLILEFIFDKTSKSGDEYPRWHTEVKNGSGESQQTIPINPRQWETAFNAINTYIIDNDYPNILKMKPRELEEVLEGIFDPDFITEFVVWFEDHKDRVDLDMIMADPNYLILDDNIINDIEKAKPIVNNLSADIIDRFKADSSELTDEKLANIIIWMGRNFKEQIGITLDFIEHLIGQIFKDDSDFAFYKYEKTSMMLEAAYPCNNNVNQDGKRETFEYSINSCINRTKNPWPENAMDIIKGYMKEYFPWRLSGDEIIYYDDVKKNSKK